MCLDLSTVFTEDRREGRPIRYFPRLEFNINTKRKTVDTEGKVKLKSETEMDFWRQ